MTEDDKAPPSAKDDMTKSASPEQSPKKEGEGMRGLNVIFGTAGAFVALMSLLVFKGKGPRP